MERNPSSWLPATIAAVGAVSLAVNGVLDALGLEIARKWLTVAGYSVSLAMSVAGFILVMVQRQRTAEGVLILGEEIQDALRSVPSTEVDTTKVTPPSLPEADL